MRKSARRIILIATLAMVAILGLPPVVQAAPITWSFTGPISFASGDFLDLLGAPATYSVTWESSTPIAFSCPPGSGVYIAQLAGTVSVGDLSIVHGGGAVEVNAPSGNCSPGSLSGAVFHTFMRDYFDGHISVFLEGENIYGADLSAILADVYRAQVEVNKTGLDGFRFTGPLQVITPAPVPEPGTMILVGGGLLAAFVRRRGLRRPFRATRHR
jgi:hypothetical protein